MKTATQKEKESTMKATEKNQYDEQAEKFLTDCGLTFKATRAKTQTTPPWDIPGERSGLRYWITIARAGKGTRGRLSFPFWDSIAAREAGTTPRAYDVLACISGDIFTPETFSEFCAEYDYSEDSRKGFATFKRCDRFARRLRAFFSEDEQEQLAEIR